MASSYHHEQCPFCGQQFLGFTDADMIEHMVDNHEDMGRAVATKLGMPITDRVVCDDCGREYVTHNGDCPWCDT